MFRRRRTTATELAPSDLAREIHEAAPVLERYRGAPPAFGAPTRCPSCPTFGMVTTITRTPVVAAENECPGCRTTWTITRRALRAVQRAGSVRAALAELGEEPPATLIPNLGADLALSGLSGPLPPAVSGAATVAPAGPLSLLLVEDDPADAALVEAILEPVADEVRMRRAWSRSEGEKLARDPSLDLVLLDLGLPDSSGLTTLHRWQPGRDVPLLVLSGNDNGGLEDASYRYGVHGFLRKQGLFDLLEAGERGTREMVDLFRATAGVAVGAAPAPAGPRVPPRGTWAN